MTPFETMLISAIGAGIVGIASFITWFVKQILPKIFEYSDRLISGIDNFGKKLDEFGKKMDKIPEAMAQVENTVRNHTTAVHRIETEVYRMREDLLDTRFKSLQEQIAQSHHPESRKLSSGGNN
jgi:hypothetical protein